MKLSEVRIGKLLDPKELAEKADVSVSNIHAIEVGRWLPSLATVRKLSAALEIDPLEVDEFRAAIEQARTRSRRGGKGVAVVAS
jgi:DNA-binding XRE family transcriptional regulator